MYRLGRILGRISELTSILGGLVIALMMFQITADVVLRAAFDHPLPGTITIVSYYYMVIAAFIPLAFIEQKDSHISVEVLTERMPLLLQRHLAGWMLLFSVAAFSGLALRSWQEAVKKFEIGASIVQGNSSFPIWPSHFVLPFGFGLMAIVAIYKFFIYLSGTRSGLSRWFDEFDPSDKRTEKDT